MNIWLKFCLPGFALILLGTLLTLAFAPFSIFPFAFIALVGLLFFWQNVSPRHAFYRGFLFGIGFFGSGVYWVFTSMYLFGELPLMLAFIFTALFIAIMALFPASVGYFCNRFFFISPKNKHIFAFPAIWLIFEWLRSTLFTGFPWLLVGYSQLHSPLSGYAPLLSVYGVSLLTLVASALLMNAGLYCYEHQYARAYRNLLTLVCIAILGTGLTYVNFTHAVHQPISVSLIQGNIPQALKWTPENLSLSFSRYEILTLPLLKKNHLIIWPETAIPMTLQDASDFIMKMQEITLKKQATLLLGIPIEEKNPPGFYNAIISLGTTQQIYKKRHLVPFGEFIPFKDTFENLFKMMNIPMSDLLPGEKQQQPFVVLNGQLKISASICYEIIYPLLVNFKDPFIGALLVANNDAWYGKSSAQAQHLEMAAMRALELERPVLFVSNDGLTAIIDAKGNIKSSLPPRETLVLNSEFYPALGLTPFMVWGMSPMIFILCFLLMMAYIKQKPLLREKKHTLTKHLSKK